MKYQLFISQACHINTGSILGWDAKRRNKSSVETKKNVRIDHRGEKGEGGAVWLNWVCMAIQCWPMTPLTYTYSQFLSVLMQFLYCTTLWAWSYSISSITAFWKLIWKVKNWNLKRRAEHIVICEICSSLHVDRSVFFIKGPLLWGRVNHLCCALNIWVHSKQMVSHRLAREIIWRSNNRM